VHPINFPTPTHDMVRAERPVALHCTAMRPLHTGFGQRMRAFGRLHYGRGDCDIGGQCETA
jgi:hypothetical protein